MQSTSSSTLKHQKFSTTAADRLRLSGRLIIPEKPRAVIQFNGGTAAKKEFYLPFLEYLAQQGFVACLWDYRGSGESAPQDMAACKHTFQEYGTLDMPAIKKYLQDSFPELPFLIVGHSVGGQLVGFMEDLSGIRGFLGFGVSTGYMKHMPWAFRAQSNFFFYFFTPLSLLFSGYLKAKPFKLMENLPAGVVKEWRAWCEKKDYLFDKKYYGKTVPLGNFQNYKFPVHVFWASDDPISNANSVPDFWSHVQSSREITLEKIDAQEQGVSQIGHFGYFKKSMRNSLWPEALAKLEMYLQ